MDYKKLGFKCGLEIHQQLEGKKLFCDCATINSRDKSDINFERKLRAVAGETGEVDKAAKYEMEKSKLYIYEADSKDCCLVEMDEEPPHLINKQAVDAILQTSLLLNAKIVDEIQVMRKTVVDGSNVSGFQRTALVGYDGKLETSKGIIRIPTICLEEEAAQKITETKEHTKYRLDRLGIPLIEIATDVDIKDNEHAKEVAEKLGMILRSTGKVKRGIGTIRQDVNVSIKGRERVEIKGFQELRSMSKVIEKEVKRQSSLKKKEQSHVRKVESDGSTTYLRPMSGAARMYPETDVMPIKPDIKHIKIPKLISDKIKHISKKYKISEDMARLLLKHNVDLDYYVKRYPNLKPLLITEMFVTTPKEIRKRHNVELDIWKHGDEVLEKLNQGVISKDAVVDILVDLAKGKKIDYSKFKTVDDKKLEAEVKNIVESKKGLGFGAYMGILMGKYKGKVDGKKLSELLKKYVK